MRSFRKVLIANRGDVAVRVIRACRLLHIDTVAVYSAADENSVHAEIADEAVDIGLSPATDSYLNQRRILEAAVATGADAIHPGFGFLAENAEFAALCEKSGIVFIGPSPSVMSMMASKSQAKQVVEALGIPTIPGHAADTQDPQELAEAAATIGYPVMIKAAAGGGGMGIRIVESSAQFLESLESVCREAESAFGNRQVLLEKYMPSVRHIEIQIIGDSHGTVLHCYERECSLQRRRQKVIEEAPSPSLSEKLRQRILDAAVQIAKHIHYVGVGTVEFIVPTLSEEFYFLEVNPRLQVEHGITELITGLDLVTTQIEVAEGKPLAIEQANISVHGHAIECRLNAEDPLSNFSPETGTVEYWEPGSAVGLRVDSGIRTGSEVTSWYDSMLAKMMIHAEDRDTALGRMSRCLNHTKILGVTTNQHFLRALIGHPAYANNNVSTRFIDEELEDMVPVPDPLEVHRLLIVAAAHNGRAKKIGGGSAYPTELNTNALLLGRTHHVRLIATKPDIIGASVDEIEYDVRVLSHDDDGSRLRISIAGHSRCYTVKSRDKFTFVFVPGLGSWVVQDLPRLSPRSGARTAGNYVAAMTGVVRGVFVEKGSNVKAGQSLLVLESMKMETTIQAEGDGVVKTLAVKNGDVVEKDMLLVDVEHQS